MIPSSGDGDPKSTPVASTAIPFFNVPATPRPYRNSNAYLASHAERARIRRLDRPKSSLAHGWDRDRARPAVGEGLPFPLFRLQNGITIERTRTFPPSFGITCLRAGPSTPGAPSFSLASLGLRLTYSLRLKSCKLRDAFVISSLPPPIERD